MMLLIGNAVNRLGKKISVYYSFAEKLLDEIHYGGTSK